MKFLNSKKFTSTVCHNRSNGFSHNKKEDKVSDITTNFFEITISPNINCLYISEVYSKGKYKPNNNAYAWLSNNSVVSLFPLENSESVSPKPHYIEWLVRILLFKALEKSSTIFDIDEKNGEFSILDQRLVHHDGYSILRRVVTRLFHSNGKLLLAIDPVARLYNRLSLNKLLENSFFSPQDFLSKNRCLVFIEKDGERKWLPAFIRDISRKDSVKVEVPSVFNGTIEVAPSRVIPTLSKSQLSIIARNYGLGFNFDKEVKQTGDFTSVEKMNAIRNIHEKYIRPVFPIKVQQTSFDISSFPISGEGFAISRIPSDHEPLYIIERPGVPIIRNRQRLTGLSSVKISNSIKEHNVVLFGTQRTIGALENIISQLNTGISQNQYRLSLPEHFGIKLIIKDRFVVADYKEYERVTDIFVRSSEEKHKNALVFMYLPPQSDLYYIYKAKLAYHGIVSQVISKEIADIYSLWNLAANVYSKLGYEPWGISESRSYPNADIVLGLAYSTLKSEGRNQRNIGYVNVFGKNSVWQFVQSETSFYDFEDRIKIIPQMVKNAIIGYLARGSEPKIIDIHYSKKFSQQERRETFEAIKSVIPNIQEVNFISLDKTHPLRVFDMSNSNLNFLRGGIFNLRQGEFLLAIAGERKDNSIASRLLKVKIWREPFAEPIDVLPVAYRILAMTKLNWRSAVRETTEPVTLKYAEEIAKLTNHFSLTEWNAVNNQLSTIPWFI